MIEKYNDADAIITIEGRKYALYKNGPILTADVAIQLIRNYFNKTVKGSHGRYMFWRHCYKAFSENRNATDKQIIDYLSLHLAFIWRVGGCIGVLRSYFNRIARYIFPSCWLFKNRNIIRYAVFP